MSNLHDNIPDTHASKSATQAQDPSVAAALSDVTFVHSKNVVALDHVSFSIPAGKRTCIVGANGSGKSTVASILSGLTAPDEGTVTFAKDATLGYLEQETELMGDRTALNEVIESAHEIKQWERKINNLSLKITETPEGAILNKYLDDYAHAMERFERLGGYELESKALTN